MFQARGRHYYDRRRHYKERGHDPTKVPHPFTAPVIEAIAGLPETPRAWTRKRCGKRLPHLDKRTRVKSLAAHARVHGITPAQQRDETRTGAPPTAAFTARLQCKRQQTVQRWLQRYREAGHNPFELPQELTIGFISQLSQHKGSPVWSCARCWRTLTGSFDSKHRGQPQRPCPGQCATCTPSPAMARWWTTPRTTPHAPRIATLFQTTPTDLDTYFCPMPPPTAIPKKRPGS